MIERKTTLTMQCDECGCNFIDNSGHVVNMMDYNADDLFEMAEKKGWSFGINPYGWLCPDCVREGKVQNR